MTFRLYYQNPNPGIFLMRLVVRRLLRDVQKLGGKPVPA